MIHLIGNAHIDPVWLWKRSEGLAEIRATFRSALERMKEFSEYHFTSACAYYYAWIEAVDPPMLREIQQRVQEGRWHIAGGMWVQPDNHIPSGESLVRHFLYSQRTFRQLFGQTARVGYLVDSFGQNGMTPQLLKKAGMDYFVFQRPDLTEKDWETELFLWESPDGSRVLCYRMPKPYGEQCGGVLADELIDEKLTLLRELYAETGRPQMCFYGVGNHGGGPTVRTLNLLRERNEAGDLHHTSMEDFFVSVKDTPGLPVFRTPLLHHASGCYSAHAALKAANARAENALRVAETYDTLCALRLGVPAQTARLREAWETVMFNQFHDILAGCSIREACEEALDGYRSVCHTAMDIGELARHRLAANLCTTRNPGEDGSCEKLEMRRLWAKNGEGAPVVVFNPHPFPVQALVPLNTLLPVGGVRGLDGQPLPVQTFRGQHTLFAEKDSTLFRVEVPAFGHTVVYLYYEALDGVPATALSCTDTCLENPYLRVEFDPQTGWISRFYDKVNKRELAAGALTRAVAIENGEADTWAHRIFTFDEECGAFTLESMQLLETGPLRGCIRVRSRYGRSVLVQDYSLTADGRGLEVVCTLELHDIQKFIKLVFPTALSAPEAVYAMPFGYRTHPLDGMEQPASEWAGLWDQQTHQGLALACCGKYSYSASGSELRVTIARSAYYADHDGERDAFMDVLDEGKQTFRYAIMPLDGDPTPVVRQLAVMHQPLDVVYEAHHDGVLPAEYTGISVSCPNVSVSAYKYGEDGDGPVLRVWETAGVATEATVHPEGLPPLTVSLAPQEVQTFLYGPDGWQAMDFIENPKNI